MIPHESPEVDAIGSISRNHEVAQVLESEGSVVPMPTASLSINVDENYEVRDELRCLEFFLALALGQVNLV